MRGGAKWADPGRGPGDIAKGARPPKAVEHARVSRPCAFTVAVVLFTGFFYSICILERGSTQLWTAAESGHGRALRSGGLAYQESRQKRVRALHGMGLTFRTGTRAMSELVVAHLAEPTSPGELKMFLRTLHRSGTTAKADVVLLFPGSPTEAAFRVIEDEEESFQRIMLRRQSSAPPHSVPIPEQGEDAGGVNRSDPRQQPPEGQAVRSAFRSSNSSISPFNAKAYWKSREERKVLGEQQQQIWGNATAAAAASNGSGEGRRRRADWADWGSIVGFEIQDLDQGEVLRGFFDDPPAQLRRWACYQMLLGMMKSRYRTVLLTEVRGVFILRDVLAAARKKGFESGINLYREDMSWNDVHKARKKRAAAAAAALRKRKSLSEISDSARKGGGLPDEDRGPAEVSEMHFIEEVYGKDVWRNLDNEDRDKAALGSGFIMGNVKLVRSLANAMLTEIAALALKRKSRRPFHDRALLNHLVQKSSVLSRRVTEKLHLVSNGDATVHALPGSKQSSVFFRPNGRGFAALLGVHDGSVPDAAAIRVRIRAEICSSREDSWAYDDCAPR